MAKKGQIDMGTNKDTSVESGHRKQDYVMGKGPLN